MKKVSVKIIGFAETPRACVVLNDGGLTIFVNSMHEYKTYQKMIGQTVELLERKVPSNTVGKPPKIYYDLIRTELDEDTLANLFAKTAVPTEDPKINF